jgi:hypothetical protein
VKYIPAKREHIVHVYRRDEPHGIERAVCGWRPPGTWHPKSGPVPLTALPDCERCPSCLDQIANEPRQLYALMPPEDWGNWEEPVTPEPDPSGDPATTGLTDSKTGEVAARADVKAQRPWNQMKWWRVVGLTWLVIALAVAVGILASGGSDNSSSTRSGTGVANSAPSAGDATPKESKPEGRPARIGQTGGLPLRNGDFQVESVSVSSNSRGEFVGTAGITYTGGNPEGEGNFTVTLLKGGQEVGALQGKAKRITRNHAATVQLTSSDRWVEGPYTYDFET